MRSYFYLVPIIFLVLFWSSCRKDLAYGPSAGNLEFSKDTVFLDTVFSSIGSSTYTLKVYNRTRDDVEIPSIRLEQGQNSDYRLNVDGVAGKEFSNIPILAEDSLFVFIETTVTISDNDQTSFLYTDAIHFDSGNDLQKVQLVTLIKDAIFLYPKTLSDGTKETIVFELDKDGNEIRTEGFFLKDEQLSFTNSKPYVIYGYAAVPQNKELTIAAGSRVHFHENSGILVTENASLKINGMLSPDMEALENEVIFEGDRLEPEYDDIPGQWGSLWLSKGSIDNVINHLTLKNATLGIYVEDENTPSAPTLTIKNTQIYNSASINLWCKTATVIGENCVFGTAGNISLYCNNGGDYSFTHTTIANYWQKSYRANTALQIDNFSANPSESEDSADLVKASFVNCIIDGNKTLELSLRSNNDNTFNFHFLNCMLQFDDNSGDFDQNPLYDFQNTVYFERVFLNENPDFKKAQNNDLRIGESSFAKENANADAALLVPIDILGTDRVDNPAIGAYQNVPF